LPIEYTSLSFILGNWETPPLLGEKHHELEKLQEALGNYSQGSQQRLAFFNDSLYSLKNRGLIKYSMGQREIFIRGENLRDFIPIDVCEEGKERIAILGESEIGIYRDGNLEYYINHKLPKSFRFDYEAQNLWLSPQRLKKEILEQCTLGQKN